MNDVRKMGRVTIPTDTDAVSETLDLLKRWGADAIRDCDGTEFPQELKDTGAKIYATYYTTRKDNAWAKANPDETQQCYIMTPFYTAEGGALTIPLMTGISRELMKVNDHDDIARWWEVIDRTTGEPVPTSDWCYDTAAESVVIDAPAAYHEYTVSFLAYLIWDPVHMYNSVINDWKDVEHQIPFDVRQPKTHAYTMRRLREYLESHPYVNVVRFTTFFHLFTLVFDELRREKYVDWYGYSASVCPYILEQFEKEVKEITALIDKPIGMIDSQIKEYEEKQKAEKKSQIQAAYDESIGDFGNDLPFERIFDTRYLNATLSLSKAMSEVIEKIEKFKTDIATIDSLDSKHKLNVRDVYVRTLDLSQAMAEDRRLRELEERLEADRKAKEEAERKRQEAEAAKREEAERQRVEAERIAAEQKAAKAQPESEPEQMTQPVSEMGRAIASIEHQAFAQAVQAATEEKQEAPAQVPEKQSEPEAEVKRYKATFWCKGTLEQIKALGDYMRANNIEFGKVAK